ncbi:hypothetical protein [Filimonas effusa]|uniref:Uncharacterized protein n=1 Tax=Filimonas effusa TaxID=2508721 RepID=A0A4Q1D146_9BACT|nr:hypothetical protein [Filimonas effusa]RXK81459.1 hypothetical protein ESB13_21245 [Filimonas effusa]
MTLNNQRAPRYRMLFRSLLVMTLVVLFSCNEVVNEQPMQSVAADSAIAPPGSVYDSVEQAEWGAAIAYYEKCRLQALTEKQRDKSYFFSIKKKGTAIDEIAVKYLGDIVTTAKDTLRIVNAINYAGPSEGARRATGRVFIYDVTSRLIGSYYLGGADGVPVKVENGAMVFKYNDVSCDKTTTISFRDSIPKMIYIKCTAHGGNIYHFEPAGS